MNKTNANCIKEQAPKFITNYQPFELLHKVVPVLMGIFVFFNPFPHTTSIKEVCFYFSVVIVLILLLIKKEVFSFKTPLLLPVGLFAFWAFIGIFFALNKENSIHDFYSHLLRYILLFYILIHFFRSKKDLVNLSWIIIISSSIFSAGAIFYFYYILGHPLSTRFAAVGLEAGLLTQTPVNIIGIITLFATILSLQNLFTETHLQRRLLLVFCLLPLCVAIFLTQTRSTLLALFFSAILLFFNNKKIVIVFLSVMLIITFIGPIKKRMSHVNIYTSLRMGISSITYEITKDYPITGIGFGMQTYGESVDLKAYNDRVPDIRRNYIHTDPHNIVLDIAVRVGFVGLVFFFYIIFIFFRMCWRCITHGKDDFIKNWGRCIASCFIAFFVIGLFQPVFSHMPEVILCIIFSMITVLWRLNNDEFVKSRIHQGSELGIKG